MHHSCCIFQFYNSNLLFVCICFLIWTSNPISRRRCNATPLSTFSSHKTIEHILSKISKWQNDYQHHSQSFQNVPHDDDDVTRKNNCDNHIEDENDYNNDNINNGHSHGDETINKDNNNKNQNDDYDLPFVLITFAQTLDGMIAVNNTNNDKKKKENCSSSNLAISSAESFLLTHGLRSIHSAILIGGRTLVIDNPRLTNRLYHTNNLKLSCETSTDNLDTPPKQRQQPQAVVLDTHLRHVLKMIETKPKENDNNDSSKKSSTSSSSNSRNCYIRARPLLVCCSYPAAKKYKEQIQRYNLEQKKYNSNYNMDEEEDAIRLEPCPFASSPDDKNQCLDLKKMLHNLKTKHNIDSIMVEGGSTVLSNFLTHPSGLVHAILITLSPTLMGAKHGLAALSQASFFSQKPKPKDTHSNNSADNSNEPLFRLNHPYYSQLGPDLIVSSCLFTTTNDI